MKKNGRMTAEQRQRAKELAARLFTEVDHSGRYPSIVGYIRAVMSANDWSPSRKIEEIQIALEAMDTANKREDDAK